MKVYVVKKATGQESTAGTEVEEQVKGFPGQNTSPSAI